MTNEVEAIRQRYSRRQELEESSLYDSLNPSRYMAHQEKQRAFIRWIKWAGLAPVTDKRVLEIGCGSGDNLLQFISLGFQPENLVGNELLAERAVKARTRLPAATEILVGDASTLNLNPGSFDIVLQATVFSSILNNSFQEKLANQMWLMVKPGGGVLWYDFIFNNPNNPDVRGVSIRRIRDLFPDAEIKIWRITLAPPINRMVTKIHPSLYTLCNMIPLFRTHVLCWIQKF
jgi:ubiquinone/menaquinone biosynthesis C-methylase UbiE